MDELYQTVFAICSALIAIQVITKLFPDHSGELIRGIAITVLLLVLVKNIAKADFEISFEGIGETEVSSAAISDLVTDNGISLLRQRLYTLLDAAGIAVEGDENGVQVLYRQAETGEITIERVCVNLRYVTDRDRSFALIRSVMTEAVAVEINTA